MISIDSKHIIAFSQCPQKAYLLLNSSNSIENSEYENLLVTFQQKAIASFLQNFPNAQSYQNGILKKGFEAIRNVEISFDAFHFSSPLLVKKEGKSALGKFHYEPTVFIGTNKITKENKIELAFFGYLLEKTQNKFPVKGVIVDKNGYQHRTELGKLKRQVQVIIAEIQDFEKNPPKLILNRHCTVCQFKEMCKEKAIKEDNLSLLDRVTAKQIGKLEKKGIFTVKQLSFTYKPRRKGKRTKNPPLIFKSELQALAIRTEKTYIQKLPDLERKTTEIFLDIEGLPDDGFYYLFGCLITENDHQIYQQFWADTPQDEETIWKEIIQLIEAYPESPIYHYGTFEPSTFEKLAKRYQINIEDIKKRFVNANSFIYGKIYFPTYSNGLKDLGRLLGVNWTNEKASGLQSIIWRNRWENGEEIYKNELLTYNQEDCLALKVLVNELTRMQTSANVSNDIDFVQDPKKIASEIGQGIHNQFNSLLNFAHFNYDKKKIKFNEDSDEEPKSKSSWSKKGYEGQRKKMPKPTKIVKIKSDEFCHKHPDLRLTKTNLESKRLIIDIIFSKNGVRKAIIQYVGNRGFCRLCQASHSPTFIRNTRHTQIYGYNLKALYVYQRIALQLPYEKIIDGIKELFTIKISNAYGVPFIREFSNLHLETETNNIKKLLESPFIHADESPINIGGATQYVWVFTNEKYVVFRFSATREATTAQEFLKDYKGVLITDFFAGYDSIDCPQQKCWVHLIRDLNDTLWDSPFDKEFEDFVSEIRNLIVPIIQTVHKYGLKKRHLSKYKKQTDKFYQKHINDKIYKSENCKLFQKRFIRYRDSLFTFIEHDGITWQNNTAERGLRHITKQVSISNFIHEKLAPEYFRLVGIMQTCRFQRKSFLKFLLSKQKNIDEFGVRKRKTNVEIVGKETDYVRLEAKKIIENCGLDKFKERLNVNTGDTRFGCPKYLSPTSKIKNLVSITRLRHGRKVCFAERKKTPGTPQIYGKDWYLKEVSGDWTLKKKEKTITKYQRSIYEKEAEEVTEVLVKIKKERELRIELRRWNEMLIHSEDGFSMKEAEFDLVSFRMLDAKTEERVFKEDVFVSVMGTERRRLKLKEIYQRFRRRI